MSHDSCPCGSGQSFESCCGRFLSGKAMPERAEQLMRSRYSAYVKLDIGYLRETLWPKYRQNFDLYGTTKWATESRWTGLSILALEKGESQDRQGTVLFEARYLSLGELRTHRELSLFKKKSGRWYYLQALPEG
ncbi:YchJ family metal-binding protein [uncultured Cohaesibacter sp.]|uniref:YchJ family protein n=1 Tax=uncultured Cohaesibacter sp. TaxID=1002546 RepID=UPI00292EF4A3|nr:YchJ family metal-binding protein [uncultured Cohaesibacter sp.]